MVVKSLTRRERRRKKLLLYVAVVFCIAIFFYLIYSSLFKIADVEVTGAKHTDIVALKNDVQGILQGNRFLIIPNWHTFLYPKGNIEEYILKTYPSVETVDVGVSVKKVVKIEIKDRLPLGVWCGDECYFYDDEGIIFKKSFKYTGPIFTAWERNPKTSVSFLEKVSCEDLCTNLVFSKFLGDNQIERAVISEEMVEFYSANGYMIKAGFNASTTMSHIRTIGEQKPDFLNGLEYVDVRFPTKIFYKEKAI
ncbi:MAG: hypothetical protein V4686_00470 [Patescibacteria group bacterium]